MPKKSTLLVSTEGESLLQGDGKSYYENTITVVSRTSMDTIVTKSITTITSITIIPTIIQTFISISTIMILFCRSAIPDHRKKQLVKFVAELNPCSTYEPSFVRNHFTDFTDFATSISVTSVTRFRREALSHKDFRVFGDTDPPTSFLFCFLAIFLKVFKNLHFQDCASRFQRKRSQSGFL